MKQIIWIIAWKIPHGRNMNYLEIISKNRKDSENLPLHFIPKSYYENVQLPKYRYVVDADNNQKLIEEELEKESLIPLDFHYIFWRADKF